MTVVSLWTIIVCDPLSMQVDLKNSSHVKTKQGYHFLYFIFFFTLPTSKLFGASRLG